jgi:uncharacterized Zn finger protein
MTKYIDCESCGEPQATYMDGDGTTAHPFAWECSECGAVFASDEEPGEDD